jgi:hypothetical protein
MTRGRRTVKDGPPPRGDTRHPTAVARLLKRLNNAKYTKLRRDAAELKDYSFFARRPSRWTTILALIGCFLIIVKLEDHDIRAEYRTREHLTGVPLPSRCGDCSFYSGWYYQFQR